MKATQAKDAGTKNSAKKKGLPVKSNIKAGDFWDDMRSAYASAYDQVSVLTVGSSDSGK